MRNNKKKHVAAAVVFVSVACWLIGASRTDAPMAEKQSESTGSLSSLAEPGTQTVAPSTSAVLSPLHTYIAPAETCTLQVRVESTGDSLGCIECWVSFDTSLVTLIHAEEGSLFQNASDPTLFFWRHIAPDTESVEGCILGFGTYVLTPGEIARYVFEAKQEGTCPVQITRLNLFDIDRIMYQPVVDPNAWIIIGPAAGVDPPAVQEGGLKVYPNPFNPAITLVLNVPKRNGWSTEENVTLSIYSSDGRRVRDLFNGKMPTGENRITWDGLNNDGTRVASGIYLAVAKTPRAAYRAKLVLVQ